MGQLADTLVSKGYNMTDALNAEKGSRASELSKEYGIGNSTGSGSNDMSSYFNQQNQLQQEALKPAIASLQSQIPQIQKNYETQISQKQADIQPLTDRYKSLIDQIKNTGQTSVNKQTVVTSGELGKRGIEGSSTLAGQEIANATLPIEQQTQSLTQQTGLSQEADIKAIKDAIANLYNNQNTDIGNINTSMANLQAGGGQNAINQAMTLLANQNTRQDIQAASNYKSQQDAIANALAQQGANDTSKLTAANIANINSQISDSKSGSSNIASILKSLGIDTGNGSGQTLPQASSFKAQ